MSHRTASAHPLSLWATTRSTESDETDGTLYEAGIKNNTSAQKTSEPHLSDISSPLPSSLHSPLPSSFTSLPSSLHSPPPPSLTSSPSSLASPPPFARSTSTPNPAAYGTTLYPFGLYGFGRPLSSYSYSPFAIPPLSTSNNNNNNENDNNATNNKKTTVHNNTTTPLSSPVSASPHVSTLASSPPPPPPPRRFSSTPLSTLSLGTSSPPSITRALPITSRSSSLTSTASLFTTLNTAPPIFYSETETSSPSSALPPTSPLPSSPSLASSPLPKTPKRCSIKEIATEISERCLIQANVVPFLKHMKQARDSYCDDENNLSSPSSDVYHTLQQLFPSKSHRWGEWTRLLATEGIEQVSDLMNLSESELEETGKKWPVVLTSTLKKLRRGSLVVGGEGAGRDSGVSETIELYDGAEGERVSLIQHVTPPPPPPPTSTPSRSFPVSSPLSSPSSTIRTFPASPIFVNTFSSAAVPPSPCSQHQPPFVLPSSFKNGAYVIERPLGKGQFGSAHLVRNVGGGIGGGSGGSSVNNLVVLKLIRTTTREERNKAWKEARAMACIPKSEHLVHVLDFFEEDFGICIVMSYCPGGTVQDLIEQRLEISEVSRILLEIASGLRVLHDNSMVHRDVKPDNLFLTESRKIRIGDFGLARTSDDSGYIYSYGCRPYMAPELRMTQMSPASDMWALGCVAVGLITGRTMEARHQIGAWMLGALPPQDIFDFVDLVTEPLESHPLRDVVKGLLHPDHHLRLSSAATVAALSTIRAPSPSTNAFSQVLVH